MPTTGPCFTCFALLCFALPCLQQCTVRYHGCLSARMGVPTLSFFLQQRNRTGRSSTEEEDVQGLEGQRQPRGSAQGTGQADGNFMLRDHEYPCACFASPSITLSMRIHRLRASTTTLRTRERVSDQTFNLKPSPKRQNKQWIRLMKHALLESTLVLMADGLRG